MDDEADGCMRSYEGINFEMAAWINDALEGRYIRDEIFSKSPAFFGRCELYKRCMDEKSSTGRD